MKPIHLFFLIVVLNLCLVRGSNAGPEQVSDLEVKALVTQVMFSSKAETRKALAALENRGKKDVVASLILALRYIRSDAATLKTLSALTGEELKSWHDAMLWQQAHPEIIPHSSFRETKLKLLEQIDPNFMRFLAKDRSLRDRMDIRLEEIVWGGVGVDAIPSLDNPKLVAARDADYLSPQDLVFGVSIHGDSRAYPLRIMGWHEMLNDVIGGIPVALAYCTLCGAGIVFETRVDGRSAPFVFGSSGLLYRSNKLMFDRETDSLWNQFTGEPVVGPLRGSGIRLKMHPVTVTSWGRWQTANPQTKVLSLKTGYQRDYGSGVVYRDYFASPDLMFPALVRREHPVRRKDRVFGIRDVGAAKAWPLDVFKDQAILNDRVGSRAVVLVGHGQTRTVRAYDRGQHRFDRVDDFTLRDGSGTHWQLTEQALLSNDGRRLARVPGHVSYWFAWDGYLGVESELYEGERAN